jgi:hypothetical protein
VVQHLPSKCEALSSNPSRKKEGREGGKEREKERKESCSVIVKSIK